MAGRIKRGQYPQTRARRFLPRAAPVARGKPSLESGRRLVSCAAVAGQSPLVGPEPHPRRKNDRADDLFLLTGKISAPWRRPN